MVLRSNPGSFVETFPLDTARDDGGWRLAVMRSRFAPMTFGFVQADQSEDEIAFDCANRTYAYARRTLLLAGAVVRNETFPYGRGSSNRFAVAAGGANFALAAERLCALKDVPAK
jgi:hypothetical protein